MIAIAVHRGMVAQCKANAALTTTGKWRNFDHLHVGPVVGIGGVLLEANRRLVVGFVGATLEALIAVQLTLLHIRVRFIVADDRTAVGTFETFRVKLDFAAGDHDGARHDIVTLVTSFTIFVIIILATVQFAVLLEIPASQLFMASAAPVHYDTITTTGQRGKQIDVSQ